MAYCPICGTDHDPDFPCTDKAGHMLRRTGVKSKSPMSSREFTELSRKARKSLIVYSVILVGALLLGTLLWWYAYVGGSWSHDSILVTLANP